MSNKKYKRPKYNPLRVGVFAVGAALLAFLIIFLAMKYIIGPIGADKNQQNTSAGESETQPDTGVMTETESEDSEAEEIDPARLAEIETAVEGIRGVIANIDTRLSGNAFTRYAVTEGIEAYAGAGGRAELIKVSDTYTGNYEQTLYFQEDKLAAAFLKGAQNYNFYVSGDELIRVSSDATNGSATDQQPEMTDINDPAQFEAWYYNTVSEAKTYLQSAYTAIEAAKAEAAARAEEEKAKKEAEEKEAVQKAEAEKKENSKKEDSKKEDSKKDDDKNTAKEVIPEISTKKLTKSDLKGLTKEQLQTAVNELYARNGYKFSSKTLLNHFKQFSWYKPDTTSTSKAESRFNKTEAANFKLILDYQKEKGYRGGSASKEETSKPSSGKEETTDKAPALVCPNISSKKLSKSDISGLSKAKLQTALNELFARNGYKFSNKDKLAYFKKYDWYKPDTSNEATVRSRFNDTEKANFKLITEYQVEKGWRDPSTL